MTSEMTCDSMLHKVCSQNLCLHFKELLHLILLSGLHAGLAILGQRVHSVTGSGGNTASATKECKSDIVTPALLVSFIVVTIRLHLFNRHVDPFPGYASRRPDELPISENTMRSFYVYFNHKN